MPDEKLTNFDLEKMVDTSDEWIQAADDAMYEAKRNGKNKIARTA